MKMKNTNQLKNFINIFTSNKHINKFYKKNMREKNQKTTPILLQQLKKKKKKVDKSKSLEKRGRI